MSTLFRSFAGPVLTATVLSAGIFACTTSGDSVGEGDDEVVAESCSDQPEAAQEWCNERVKRQTKIDAYLKDSEFDNFLNGALGIGGVPMPMFRLFPELFPEIWGKDFSRIGTMENPFAASPLPLGYTYSPSDKPIPVPGRDPVALNMVGLNCAACHVGRVIDDEGKSHFAVGAPNTTINRPGFLVPLTATDPRFTAENFRKALADKPQGWVYGDDPSKAQQEALERAVLAAPGVMEAVVDAIQKASKGFLGRFKATLGAAAYSNANSPDPFGERRGSMEVIGLLYLRLDPTTMSAEELLEKIPNAPASIDPPSIWNQAERPRGNFDGSMQNLFYRNLGAASATGVTTFDFENLHKLTGFIKDLPPAPYPFDVDMEAARRGKPLYKQNCASCHDTGKSSVTPLDEIGTDPNLIEQLSPIAVELQRKDLMSRCTSEKICSKSDGTPVPAEEIVEATGGYAAQPLDGIWARAPYLHNGSVPTLHALLTGDRPTTFVRGNLTYDKRKVGFTWNEEAKGTVVYDTRLPGNSSRGHSGKINGKDWSKHPEELADLLEYMKTL